jgi:predicted acetyltransferase
LDTDGQNMASANTIVVKNGLLETIFAFI